MTESGGRVRHPACSPSCKKMPVQGHRKPRMRSRTHVPSLHLKWNNCFRAHLALNFTGYRSCLGAKPNPGRHHAAGVTGASDLFGRKVAGEILSDSLAFGLVPARPMGHPGLAKRSHEAVFVVDHGLDNKKKK